MLSVSHTSFGLFLFFLISSVVGLDWNYLVLAFVSLGAILPDIDMPESAIGMLLFPISRWIYEKYGHRTITHSLRFWLGMTALSFIVSLFFGLENLIYAFAFSIGILAHLISDGMTKSGVPLLYPDLRPFYFLPENLLITTGTFQEYAFTLLFFSLSGIFGGISYFSWRHIVNLMFPTARHFFQNYKDCYPQCFTEIEFCKDVCEKGIYLVYFFDGNKIYAVNLTYSTYLNFTEKDIKKIKIIKKKKGIYTVNSIKIRNKYLSSLPLLKQSANCICKGELNNEILQPVFCRDLIKSRFIFNGFLKVYCVGGHGNNADAKRK